MHVRHHHLTAPLALIAPLAGPGACTSDDAEEEQVGFDASSAPTDATIEEICAVTEGFGGHEPSLDEDDAVSACYADQVYRHREPFGAHE